MANHPLIIVSNRLPVSVSKVDGKLEISASSGGLASAMSSIETDQTKIWLGWPGIASDDLTVAEKRKITTALRKHNCAPVFLTKQQIADYYDGYSNGTLWPLFHYFQYYTVHKRDWWRAYQQVNAAFRRAVVRYAGPESTIWVHDYHLMLLPRLVRESLPKSTIGFFLHIPFPSYEIFRLLPNRQEILEGMLGADLVGFHTYDYVQHFTNSVVRALGYDRKYNSVLLKDRVVVADAFPVSIDYQKFANAIKLPAVKMEIDNIRNHYKDEKIILSVDRLDYSKGILERLEAFDVFLAQNPHSHKKVRLLIVAVPSRVEVEAYKSLRDKIDQAVSRINGAYATADWTPISYQYKHLPFEQIVALFYTAHIALVTPLRDGMNLVAKEYVACKQNKSGVLILSEMAGAASELPEAMVVSPNNIGEIAHAIQTALKMPRKTQRHALITMQARIKSYDNKRWAADFLGHLYAAKAQTQTLAGGQLSASMSKEIRASFTKASRRLFLLDYDGTLRKFVRSPLISRARPSKALLDIISKLAEDPLNTICVISGRTHQALEAWFDQLPINLIAEHGAWLREAGQAAWRKSKFNFRPHKELLLPILKHHAERTPGAVVEEKSASLVWHYRNVPAELASARNRSLCHAVTSAADMSVLSIYEGNKILEIRPKEISKGAIVEEMIRKYKPDFILCAGDDSTDEDMFEELPRGAYSIKVGLGLSRAILRIASVKQLHNLLKSLT